MYFIIASLQPYFLNVSKHVQNIKNFNIGIFVSRLVLNLKIKAKQIRGNEAKLKIIFSSFKHLMLFLKGCEISEHSFLGLTPINVGV